MFRWNSDTRTVFQGRWGGVVAKKINISEIDLLMYVHLKKKVASGIIRPKKYLNVNILSKKILKHFFQEQLDYLLMPPPTSTPVRHIISPARVR